MTGLVCARFPLHDLERLLGWPVAVDLAHRADASLAAVKQWRTRGLSWRQADELACRFGWHPLEVWGLDWLDPMVPAGHPRADPPQRIWLTIYGTIGIPICSHLTRPGELDRSEHETRTGG